MNTIFPFKGWRYDPAKVDPAKVVAPPYDVIDDKEQAELYSRDPHNVIRLILGRTFPKDSAEDNRYTRAASHLDAWREEGLFRQDRPAIYLYEQKFHWQGKEHARRGFFARILLSEWGKEGIYPHEKTLSGPKQDRLDLMRATRGNLEPIFGLLADPEGEAARCLAGLAGYPPCLDVSDDDGVVNRMWVVDSPELLARLETHLSDPAVFIADGHHRYETALAYRDEIREKMRQAGQVPPLRGDLDSDYIMMFIVPDSDPGLVIWPTHRLVHGLASFSAAKFLEDCKANFDVEPVSRDKLDAAMRADELPSFGFVHGEEVSLLRLKSRAAMDARHSDACREWRELDVAVLHSLLMEDLMGIDEGKLLRKENITYVKSADAAFAAAADGLDGTQCAFILRETPMRQVREISEAGAVMPQKSTYFYPKPLSGAVFHFFW